MRHGRTSSGVNDSNREAPVGTWVLILAAGDGRRLEGVARDRLGRPVPKQFCDFGTGRTLLTRTLDRALQIAPSERIVSVVAARHERWWMDELVTLPAENVVIQPENRGTAAGILLPLLHVFERDPEATVVVLPSDHHVEDDFTVRATIRTALSEVRARPEDVVLLGITPEHADTEYGWIMPAHEAAAAPAVASFVEKPGPLEAARLLHAGALWNSFMFVGRAAALLEMFGERTPGLLAAMRTGVQSAAAGRSPATPARGLDELYMTLETRDFSRDILQTLPGRLRVLAVPNCGWSDLGTPDRLARVLGGRLPGMSAAPSFTAA